MPCAIGRGHRRRNQNDEEWALAVTIAKKIIAGKLWLPDVGYVTRTYLKIV
jgi:hypothetical protein